MTLDGKQTLDSLVDYQAGSIVSRQIMKTPGGSVTAFALDAGEGLSEHATPHEALLQVIDGSVRVLIGGETFEVTSGDAIGLPAGVRHEVHAAERCKMLLLMLRSDA
jgi:quercetin dioxygenase-like cupin family protein